MSPDDACKPAPAAAAAAAAAGTAGTAAAASAAEQAARRSYGRLLAILAARTRDIAAAEDALADAFARALERWPVDGIPQQPEAWLLSAARNRTLDAWRHQQVRDDAAQTLLLLADEFGDAADGAAAVPDERLRLFFVCAHPAIDAAARAPLMLQAVLGLDAARMAGAFLSSPASLGQRLVRAKARIRAAGIGFEFPRATELPQRLADVLDGIYAAYGTGWDGVDGGDAKQRGLTAEAIELARILCLLLPAEPEPLGLLALMLFCESRAGARRDEQGGYVPLAAQALARWDHGLRGQAEESLQRAAALQALGPYQIEAAIQSAHCARRLGAEVPAAALVSLYDGLLALRPGVAAQVSRACAVAEDLGPAAGLLELDRLPPRQVADYQPFWAARAHWLGRAGRRAEAQQAYARAAGLSTSSAIRDWLVAASARL